MGSGEYTCQYLKHGGWWQIVLVKGTTAGEEESLLSTSNEMPIH